MLMEIFARTAAQEGQISALLAPIFAIALYLVAAFFMLRMLVLVVVGQIDISVGRSGALADVLVQSLYGLLALLLAVNAPAIHASVQSIIRSNSAVLTGSELSQLGLILQPMASLVIGLALTLAVSAGLVAVIFNALRGQVASLSGAHGGLSEALAQGFFILVVFGVGAIAIVIGSRLITGAAQ